MAYFHLRSFCQSSLKQPFDRKIFRRKTISVIVILATEESGDI